MKRCKLILAFVCALVLSTGCASRLTDNQKKSVSGFAQSASQVGSIANIEFKSVRDEVIGLNLYAIALNIDDSPEWNDLDQAVNEDSLKRRQNAVQTLENYGDLLYSLSSNDKNAELDKAANKFTDGVKDLDQDQKVSSTSLDVIKYTVKGLGRLIVEKKKKKAITDVVTTSRSQIDHLCNLIIEDFDGDRGFSGQLLVASVRLQIGANDVLLESKDIEDRQVAINAFYAGSLATKRVNEYHPQIAQAAKNLKISNQKLYVDLHMKGKNPFTSINNFKSSVKKLSETVQFYVK
tara:strand:- start:6661 stop:7539 length:879 start_codon:yes stop_codon:yes gene_type:complete